MYKLFKKSNVYIKFLKSINDNVPFKVARVTSFDMSASTGYDEDGNLYLDINQCPRLICGDILRCKNILTNEYEKLGKLKEIQYDDDIGYLLIF